MGATTKRRMRGHLAGAMLIVGIVGTVTLVQYPDSLNAGAQESTTTTTNGVSSTTTSTVAPPTTTTTLSVANGFPWPAQGSAAVAIPQLSVSASSPKQPRLPIASLTKMMTTWVVLLRKPLTYAQQGPCLTVNAHDVALWKYDLATGQSNAKIALGERLCEGTLLRGLLVHSAGNYAQLLSRLVGLGEVQFVALMNHEAAVLGLRHTHYVDYSGIGAGNTSTASDQATMAIDLMQAQPIVRQIVRLPSVWLPVAGVVSSYTPDVGQYGVVGVKSGYTPEAGGCDVMAIDYQINNATYETYAVVLGQFSSNPLGLAGQAALTLSQKLRSYLRVVASPSGRTVAWRGPVSAIVPTPTSSTTTSTATSTSTTTTSAATTTTSTGVAK